MQPSRRTKILSVATKGVATAIISTNNATSFKCYDPTYKNGIHYQQNCWSYKQNRDSCNAQTTTTTPFPCE